MNSRFAFLFVWLYGCLGLAQQIVPTDGVGAVFTAPASTVTLQVSVSDDSGQPLPGASVLFVAPRDGPSGEFTVGSADTLTRVSTGASGVATAQFYSNNVLGPYLVSAWVEGTNAATHFAITNTISAPPPLDPKTALQAIRDQLKPAGETIVYGPFLLDPGSIAAPSVNIPAVDPIKVSAQTVFVWLDDNPTAAYDHPVRWVMLDAANANPAVKAIDRLWAPYVVPVGSGSGYGLVAPLFRLDTSAILEPSAAPAASREARSGPSIPRLGNGSNTDACAIIVYGPDSEAFAVGAAEMREVFSDTLNIPDSNIFEDTTPGKLFGVNHRPSTRSRLHDLFEKARAKGCKKLYYYFAGHGYNGGFCLTKEPSSTSTDDYDNMSYVDLAKEMENTKIPQVCVILQSCHSGSAIADLQGHGFDGEIATATDRDGLAYHNPVPGIREVFWTGSLANSWKGLGPSVSLTALADGLLGAQMQANDFVTTHYILPGHPRTGKIEAKGGQATAPSEIVIVNLDDTTLNPVKFTVSKPANFTAGAGIVEMFIDDIGVAKDPGSFGSEADQHNSRITLNKDDVDGTFVVRGLKEGSTPYKITFKDRDEKTYTATGIILVGKGYDVTPNPVQVQAGGTATVKVTRGSGLARQSGAVRLTVRPANAASAEVAAPGSMEVVFPPGATSVDLPIRGLKAGGATFQVSDGKTTKTFQVNVVAAVCPTGGIMQLRIALASDPFDSARFVMMPATANIPFMVAGGSLALNSAVPQLPSGSGLFNSTTCASSIKTISTGTIAGFRNVKVEYDVSFGDGGTTVSMVIREGTENTLNNEPQPITYRATGTVGR